MADMMTFPASVEVFNDRIPYDFVVQESEQ